MDPRNLRPGELCRLLNDTPLGPVIDERQLYRHRQRAGFRIGDSRTVDLVRYVAWLVGERRRRQTEAKSREEAYAEQRVRALRRAREITAQAQDVGELPEVVHPEQKRRAERDFRFFCEFYFGETFHLAWSPDHLKVIAKIEEAVLHGGLFALAMPRGSGKTSLAECACLWAALYGHHEFVCLIGSAEGHAESMLAALKTELETNERLNESFPEVCYPLRILEGQANRRLRYRGALLHLKLTARYLELPSIPGSAAASVVIRSTGLTAHLRGMKHKRIADGRPVRPSLVILDDPQTDESAKSPSQCAQRERLLNGAVLGLAGPGQKIAAVMPCTVIYPGDLADRILDRGENPQWQGERTQMVYRFPDNEALWKEYAEIRSTGLREERGTGEATEFYRRHREAMDEGAVVAWPERHEPDELSAIQHAMNIRLDRGDVAFWAEYQNEPLPDDSLQDDEFLDAAGIAGKLNNRPRGEVPSGATRLTAFVDVQQRLLYYVVCAWEEDFTGYVIDYGTYPDQRRAYFTLREARRTLAVAHRGTGIEGTIYAGLEALSVGLLGREWPREDGAKLRIDQCLIDSGWQSDVVYQFVRQSAHAAVLMPSKGIGIKASNIPLSERKKKRGERVGHHWRITFVPERRSVRYVLYDTNLWKSFVHQRLATAMGDRGCLSLYGEDPRRHRMLADHLTAEYRVRTTGRGREVDEWKQRPDKPDNHWLDCLVGCAVAASVQGVATIGAQPGTGRRRRRRITGDDLPPHPRRRAS